MTWNPQIVAGIGAVADPTQLHKDMHSYLAGGCHALPQISKHAGLRVGGLAN